MDLAASIQKVTEDVMLKVARHVRRETGMPHLCLAGGVALNCVGNGEISRSGIFDKIWVQPASGDAGGALGAALFLSHHIHHQPRQIGSGADGQKGSLLGPAYSDAEIERFLNSEAVAFERLEPQALARRVAGLIAEGKIIGWFQGRMEYGPRALGARSILGDPRDPLMQSKMNLKIKFRESFRPFAPAVLQDEARSYFDIREESPYMLLVAPVRESRRLALRPEEAKLFGIERLNSPRSEIPAVTHVDCSARIQTVGPECNPIFYETLKEFHSQTGCPMLINTSFNVRGEPIVCTPQQALTCLRRTDIDFLALGSFLVDKSKLPMTAETNQEWMNEFALD
jgi:carbamoyltransferase